MNLLFGLPIFTGIVVGLAFPYIAVQMMPFGFFFLFLLMFFSGLNIEVEQILKGLKLWKQIFLGLFFIFIFFPLLEWYIGRLWNLDPLTLFGLYITAITPPALVAPLFAKNRNSNTEFAFILMFLGSLLYPLFLPILLKLLPSPGFQIDSFSVFKFTIVLILFPWILSLLTSKYFSGIRKIILKQEVLLSSLCLGFLVFIFFGNALSRINIQFINYLEIFKLIALVFFQDFGVYFIAVVIIPFFLNKDHSLSLIICSSAKNTAIAANILLYFAPYKSALPAVFTFLAHAFFFGFLIKQKKSTIP